MQGRRRKPQITAPEPAGESTSRACVGVGIGRRRSRDRSLGARPATRDLDFTLVLWPYYLAVAAVYGMVTYLTKSILPAVVLHTSGTVYSNLDIWLHGQAEWQKGPGAGAFIWETGVDRSFRISSTAFILVGAATMWAFYRLARVVPDAPDFGAVRR